MTQAKMRSSTTDWLTPTQRKYLWGFLAFLCLLRLAMVFQVPFTDTTEARYAEMARKMVETNDWVTPQYDYGVPFWGKPPLHTWVSAIGIKLFGVNHFGPRIFIYLIGVGIVWMFYTWLRVIQGRDYALVGITILSSSALYYLAAGTVMTDLVMAAGVFLSMAGFYSAITQRKHAQWWGYLFFVGLGIGMLAKGPIAVVLAAIPIGGWVLLTNRWLDTWNRIPWLVGTLLTCCIFMPWYVIAELKTPGFLQYFIVGEHFHRFLDSGWDGDLYGHAHAEARGTIWVFWLAAVLPWSLFILYPLRWWRRLYQGFRSEQDSWSLYLLLWAIAPMLFFSMATNILATYVITGLPAISFLAINLWRYGAAFDRKPTTAAVWSFTITSGVAGFLIIIAGGLFAFTEVGSSRKTQMYLVSVTDELRSISSGRLYYWHKRHYSAEFYTHGEVSTLENEEEANQILNDEKRDFLAIRSDHIDDLADEFLGHFQFQGYFGKDALYYENPIPEAMTTMARP